MEMLVQNQSREPRKEPVGAAWKKYVGEVAWPTIMLTGAVFGAYMGVLWASVTGFLPMWAGIALSTGLLYMIFTPMHEAAHGNIKGRKKSLSWLETSIGWLSAFMLFAPYPAFKVLHLRHHAETNNPTEDPDNWIASRNPLMLLFKCLTIMPDYYYHFFAKPYKQAREKIPAVLVGVLAIAGAFTALGMNFGWHVPLLLWLLPAILALGILAIVFDWIPHPPHQERARYLDTRAIVMPGLETLMLGQNYHLMHHLYPPIPFYQYGKAFHEMRPLLEEKGAPILEPLKKAPVQPGTAEA